MSRIDDLIREHCPNGVEHLALGELGQFERGSGIQKSDFVAEGVGCIHYGQIHTHYGTWTTETKSFVSPEQAARTRRAKPGNLVIATTSEDDEAVGKAVAWLGAEDVAVSTDALIYRHSLDPKYVAYFFQTEQFHAQKRRHVTGTKVRRIAGGALAKIRVPVPPLDVQREIVRVLDLFQELTEELEAELEAELAARRRQYAHHRESLVRLGRRSDVEWAALPDFTSNLNSRRRAVTKSEREAGPYPYYGASGVVDQVSGYIFDGDYLLVSEDGANLLARSSPIAFSSSGKVWINNHADVLQFQTYAERRFVELYLNSIDLAPWVSGGPQPKLNKANLNRIPVPRPSQADQERIVATFDKFEASVDDLSVGLTAEFVARRRQYEYHQNRLFAFGESA